MPETLPECPKCGESGVLDKRTESGYRYSCSHCEHTWTISEEEYQALGKSSKIKIWTAGSCNTTSKRRAGGWAYLIKYEHRGLGQLEITASGNSWGTTEDQMELRAVLNAIRTTDDLERLTDVVMVYPYNVRVAKCLAKIFDCENERVFGDYLQEIEWETGLLVVEYVPTLQLASRVHDLAIQEQQKLER